MIMMIRIVIKQTRNTTVGARPALCLTWRRDLSLKHCFPNSKKGTVGRLQRGEGGARSDGRRPEK